MKKNSPHSLDHEKLEELEEKIKETKHKLEKMVQDYPLASITIAAILGFLIAKFLKRSR